MLQFSEASHADNGQLPRTRVFDQAGVEAAIFDLLVAIGEDPHRDGLRDTPARVARAYRETFATISAAFSAATVTSFIWTYTPSKLRPPPERRK